MANRSPQAIELSIVIPAYNEARRISPTLRVALTYLKKNRLKSEIIVVDDGSTDETSHLVKELNSSIKIIRHANNHGKGEAVKTGFLKARGVYVLMMDADGSIDIKELDKLLTHKDKFDVVIGSRFLRGSRFLTQNWKRMLISKGGNILFRIMFQMPISDTQCGFKLFRLEAAHKIFSALEDKGYVFDIEALVRAQNMGMSIKEVPIDWNDAPGSKIRATHLALRSLVDMWNIYMRTR